MYQCKFYLARGAADAVARRTDAVAQFPSLLVANAGALPTRTELDLTRTASSHNFGQLSKIDPSCLTDLKHNIDATFKA